MPVSLVLLVASRVGSAQGAPSGSADRARAVAAAKQIMRMARYATLVTIGDDGQPQARIVDPHAPDPDLTIWIATNPLTRKVHEIRRDPRVTLLYFNAPGAEYVTVIGRAGVVTDTAERIRHWKPAWAPFYKHGPRGDDYLLVRVEPRHLEVVSPGRGINGDAKTWKPTIITVP
ncbi:MAG TPA: pyridoxamine 5'-phosphate oxidase family protein [Gemmatimonadaceae bacterium]|nr:pyridoxamine 5'-phosphate oxidase family protein [Gemmatimonadaceae bacterium]